MIPLETQVVYLQGHRASIGRVLGFTESARKRRSEILGRSNAEFSCAAESPARSEPQQRHLYEREDHLRRQLQRDVIRPRIEVRPGARSINPPESFRDGIPESGPLVSSLVKAALSVRPRGSVLLQWESLQLSFLQYVAEGPEESFARVKGEHLKLLVFRTFDVFLCPRSGL